MSNKGADVHQDSTENKSPSVDSRGSGQHSEQSSQKPLAESVTQGSVGQGQSSKNSSQQTLADSCTQGSGGQGQSSEDNSQQTLADSGTQRSGGQGQNSEDSSQQTLADSGTQGSGGQGQSSEDSSQQILADSGTQGSGGQGQNSEDSSQQALADSGTQGSGGQGQSSKDSSQQTADSGTQGSGGQGQSSEDSSQQTLADSGTKQSGGQGEEFVDKDTGNRLKSVGTQVEQRPVIQDYLEFLGLTTKNYRFGLIMHTSVTIAVLAGWSVIWQPAKDLFCYEVLKYPRPPELDPLEVTNFMEQYSLNPECDLTELQKKYTELKENYFSLQEYVGYLQGNATDFNKTLVKHAKQIQDTSLSVKNVSSNMTEVKGQLRHQSEQTHRVQRDIDQTILKQIAEEPWKYISIIVAVGEVLLVVYVIKLKSSLRDIDRQPQAVVQPPKSFDKQHTNGFKGQPRSVLDGISEKSTENSVCILSFNNDPEHTKHVKVSMSFLGEKVKVTKCIIYREEDIVNVPPSKVVLVHVDFNSRNIILESPEREIGELKRKTVLALWKMNADVILLYHYEERNAKPLGEQDLYSSELVSVKTQTELKQLEEQQRFISLNGQLSARQRQHLSRLVKMKIG